MWCYPTEGSFKLRMRQVRKNYDKWLKKAEQLQEWVREEYARDKMCERLLNSIDEKEDIIENWLEELGTEIVEHE